MANARSQILASAQEAAARGDHHSAESCYGTLLRTEPRNPHLMLEMAVQQAIQGKYDRARKMLTRAGKLAPKDPNIPFNLALLERESGRYSAAVRYLRKVLELDPQFPEIGFDLGETLYHAGCYDEALMHLEDAARRFPETPHFAGVRAACLSRLDRRRDAISSLQQYLQAHPGAQEVQFTLGSMLYREGRHEQALAAYETARATVPVPDTALADAAEIYVGSGANELAEHFALKVPEGHKDQHRALSTLGQVLAARGDFDAAADALNRALELDPSNSMAIMRLSQIGKLSQAGAEAGKRIYFDKDAAAEDRINTGYALYRSDSKATAAERFSYLKAANELQWRIRPYDHTANRAFVEQPVATFGRDLLATSSASCPLHPILVFIVGMPRSGTTLVEEILSRCQGVFAGGETQNVPMLARALDGYPHCLTEMSAEDRSRYAQSLFRAASERCRDATFFTDKLPGNYSYVGLIKLLLPNSKIIYCRRTPADNALSLYEQNFGTGRMAYSCDLQAIADVYSAHEKLMTHWRDKCDVEIHRVDYDDLVESPEPHARALLEFVGLDWDPACLKTDKKTREINTASVWQARQPIYTGSVGKWRRYEEQMQPFLQALKGT